MFPNVSLKHIKKELQYSCKSIQQMFRPAFGCCKQPKAGRNTQQWGTSLLKMKSYLLEVYLSFSTKLCLHMTLAAHGFGCKNQL